MDGIQDKIQDLQRGLESRELLDYGWSNNKIADEGKEAH